MRSLHVQELANLQFSISFKIATNTEADAGVDSEKVDMLFASVLLVTSIPAQNNL